MENNSVKCSFNNTNCTTVIDNKFESIDGYSLPVYGLADGTFYNIHIPALVCICLSFICVVATLAYSFCKQTKTNFFKWTKNERFIVYMAICDGLFNIAHFSDHFHIVVTKSSPKPKSLCAFYGFMLEEFITAQVLLVNLIAINVFCMIYFRKYLEFGKYDHRLLLYIFGVPALGGIIAGATGQLGPNGAFCYFDGVNGNVSNIFFTTVLLVSILMADIVLYTVSWVRIRRETNEIKGSLGKSSQALTLSRNIAKTMSLFIVAFFVQWWATAVFGIWQLIDETPQLLFNFVTTFTNVGGLINGVVFIIILRRKKAENEDSDTKESVVSFKPTSTTSIRKQEI